MPSENVEQARTRFLDQLRDHRMEAALAEQGGFLAYWQQIEEESRHSEDMGQLDKWVRELSRDKDRLAELRAQSQQAAASQMGDADVMAFIQRLMMILDDIYAKLRRRLNLLRDRIGMWVFLVGPGKKSKPVPKDDEKPGKKEESKDQQTTEALLAKNQKKGDDKKKTKGG